MMQSSLLLLLTAASTVLGLPSARSAEPSENSPSQNIPTEEISNDDTRPTEPSIAQAPAFSLKNQSSSTASDTAPQPNDVAPPNAAPYTSPTGSQFNMWHFNAFIKETFFPNKSVIDSNPAAGKVNWITVDPGTYTAFVDTTKDDEGWNQDIEIAGLRGVGDWGLNKEGFTIDFRGSTFFYEKDIKETPGNPAAAIYVAQSNKFTILGGTFWINVGEPYSQGVITTKTMAADANGNDAIVDFEIVVDEGYDLDVWHNLDSGSFRVIDDRDKSSCKHIEMNGHIWGSPGMNITNIDSSTRTVSVWANAVGFEVGMHASITTNVTNMPVAVGAEMDSELLVKGMTTNGRFDQYGLHADELEGTINKPESFVDCVVTNPPLGKGMAPRVNGPVLWPGLGGWFNGDDIPMGSNPETNPTLTGSRWRNTGCEGDFLPMSQREAPKVEGVEAS